MSNKARPPQKSYSPMLSALHWGIALLVFFQLFANGPQVRHLEEAGEKAAQIIPHASVGVAILVLMLMRVLVRRYSPKPAYSDKVRKWQEKLGAFMHAAFYVLLIAQPVLGVLLSASVDYAVAPFGIVDVSAVLPNMTSLEPVLHAAHGIIPGLLFLLIVGHILIAIVHAFRRDGVFSRVLFRN